MPQSYTNLLVHIVFGTKHREHFVSEEIRNRLYEYIGGFTRGKQCVMYEIGRMPDHVHFLVRLHPDVAIIPFLRDLKSRSSGWVHQTFPKYRYFAWHAGYAAFGVSESQKEKVIRYIQGQEEHHKHQDFRSELIALLKAHSIEYDEKYLLAD